MIFFEGGVGGKGGGGVLWEVVISMSRLSMGRLSIGRLSMAVSISVY